MTRKFLICALLLFAHFSWSQVLAERSFEKPFFEFRKNKSNDQWFVAFFKQSWTTPPALKEFGGLKNFAGSFKHENYAGYSNYALFSASSFSTLENTFNIKPLFSLWDFISCESAHVSIIKKDNHIFLRFDILEKCQTIFDD